MNFLEFVKKLWLMIHYPMSHHSSDSFDPWYGNVLVYFQTQRLNPQLSRDERQRIRHQAKNYFIIGDTLYRRKVDVVLRHCLVHEEAKHVLNDCHVGACGGHLSGFVVAHKILRA